MYHKHIPLPDTGRKRRKTMSDIKLTPEMKAKIEEAKKTVSELSPDDLDGVAGGAGSVVRIYISDSNIKDNIDELIRIHKDMQMVKINNKY